MRINRSYTIEDDLIERLKNENASNLINDLLRRYFEAEEPETEEKIRTKYTELREKKAVLLKKMRILAEKLQKIKQKKEEERQKLMNEDQKTIRKEKVQKIKEQFYAGEITEKEYFDFFDG